GSGLGLSKCEALGASFEASLVPKAFHEGRTTSTDKAACNVPSFWYAVSYCTGVPQSSDRPTDMLLRSELRGARTLNACHEDDPYSGTSGYDRYLVHRLNRIAAVRLEQPDLYDTI